MEEYQPRIGDNTFKLVFKENWFHKFTIKPKEILIIKIITFKLFGIYEIHKYKSIINTNDNEVDYEILKITKYFLWYNYKIIDYENL